MDNTFVPSQLSQRWKGIFFSALLAIFGLIILVHSIAAQEIENAPPDLNGSTKQVNKVQARPGETLKYSILIENGSNFPAFDLSLSDRLPDALNLLTETLQVSGGIGLLDAGLNQITWTGAIEANSSISLDFEAVLTETLVNGQIITNSVVISATGVSITPTVTTKIVTGTHTIYLPIMYKPIYIHLPMIIVSPLNPPELTQLTRPNADNEWMIGWSVADPLRVDRYEVQESANEEFVNPTIYNVNSGSSSLLLSHEPSLENVYYYRARSFSKNSPSEWSNVIMVRGAYRDDFSDPDSGWEVRRTTFIEKTVARYIDDSLVLIVDDRWDWMIVSPLVEAPSPPYVVKYRARVHDASNLVTGGIVLGGDWNGEPCPEIGNIYQTDNCFNHFYDFNYIFYGPLKLLFERVDRLVWCPRCGGSPIKRLGDIGNSWPPFDVLDNGPSLNWHDYRVEVYSDRMVLYIDGNFVKTFFDQKYVNDPYFGVFASTDEYKPSIWFYDYFEVGYLD